MSSALRLQMGYRVVAKTQEPCNKHLAHEHFADYLQALGTIEEQDPLIGWLLLKFGLWELEGDSLCTMSLSAVVGSCAGQA